MYVCVCQRNGKKKQKKKARDSMRGCCRRVFTKPATCLTRTAHLHLQFNFQLNKAKERTGNKKKSQNPFS